MEKGKRKWVRITYLGLLKLRRDKESDIAITNMHKTTGDKLGIPDNCVMTAILSLGRHPTTSTILVPSHVHMNV